MRTTAPERFQRAFDQVWQKLPTVVDQRVIAAAWASLIVHVGIVGTGGAVRLTDSGLGCPTWPQCTAESFVATPAMGIHGVIEFGNRLLTVVLVVVAALTILAVVRLRSSRPELFRLAVTIGLYVPIQIVIGGITVLTKLNPYVVGLHYLASALLVALASVLVAAVYRTPGTRTLAVPRWYAVLALMTGAVVSLTVIIGVLVTGSGPHAGDHGAARNGLNPVVMQHVHSAPAYATVALTVALVVSAVLVRLPRRQLLWTGLLLVVELGQIGVGLWQARTGLPQILVGIHLVLAVVLVAAATAVLTHLTRTEPNA